MRALVSRLDRLLEALVEHACTVLIVMLTTIVLYSVVMRYVFLSPPFWGDTVAVLANVAMVLLGISMSVRKRDLVAMQALYEILSPRVAHALEMLWNLLILIFACLFTWYGYQTAQGISGEYWELGMLPRRYPTLILPVAGALLIIACLKVLSEDVRRLRHPESIITEIAD